MAATDVMAAKLERNDERAALNNDSIVRAVAECRVQGPLRQSNSPLSTKRKMRERVERVSKMLKREKCFKLW